MVCEALGSPDGSTAEDQYLHSFLTTTRLEIRGLWQPNGWSISPFGATERGTPPK